MFLIFDRREFLDVTDSTAPYKNLKAFSKNCTVQVFIKIDICTSCKTDTINYLFKSLDGL